MKRMKVKKTLSLLLALSMVTGLTACGSSGKTEKADAGKEGSTQADSDQMPEITLMIGQSNYYQEAFTQIIEKAKKEIGINVKIELPPDTAGTSLFQTQLATGDVPDIAHINLPNDYSRFNAEKYFLPLEDQDWVKRLNFDKKDITAEDGHIYGMPYTGYSGVMGAIYNKKVFDEVGVKVPKTYEEFKTVCEKIKQAGKTPIYLSGKDSWTIQIIPMIFMANALDDRAEEVYSSILSGEKKLADIPEFKQALSDFQDLIKSGYVNTDYTVGTYDESKQKVASGDAGMIVSGEYAVTDIVNKFSDAEIGMFPLPYNDVNKFLTAKYVFGLVIPKDSKNQEAAKKFLNFLSQPENMKIYLNANAVNSPFTDVTSDNLNPILADIYNSYFKNGELIPQIGDTLEKFGSVNSDVFWQTYTEVAAGGDIDTAINQLDAALQEYGASAKLKGFK